MSVRAFAAIGRAALQLKPYKTARSLPIATAGRYNWVAHRTASSSGEIAREPEMDQEKQTRRPNSAELHESKTHTDVMVDSFGVEYTTRSEEEGFGVIYGAGGDDPDTNPGKDKNHPDYKKSEGSQLKEKAHKP